MTGKKLQLKKTTIANLRTGIKAGLVRSRVRDTEVPTCTDVCKVAASARACGN